MKVMTPDETRSSKSDLSRKIVVWRHGQTDWNIENRFQGHTDIPLNAVGKFQVEHAAKVLLGFRPSKIVSSDLMRARQTALALGTLSGLDVDIDPGLRETHGGSWEGRTGIENRTLDGENFLAWIRGGDLAAGGNGEKRSDVAKRARKVLDSTLTRSNGTVIYVTHGGAARCLIGSLLELSIDKWSLIGGLSNASWSVLEEDSLGRWILSEHNSGSLPEPLFGNESAV
jgi:probable phosphoglycerate mutase